MRWNNLLSLPHHFSICLWHPRPTLYRLIQKGLFPKPIKIGSKASRWLESDIQEYLDKVSAERNAA
jgi:predicted DNA-binding transcriptional regulator AlpA